MLRQKFRRTQRLTKKSEFLACYTYGHKFFTTNLIIFVLPRSNVHSPSRLGTTIRRKIGSAVYRNRIKRLLRECHRLQNTIIGSGLDITIVAKRGINVKSLTLDIVADELLSCLAKIRIILTGDKSNN